MSSSLTAPLPPFTGFPFNWAPCKPKQTLSDAEFAAISSDFIASKKYDGNRCHLLTFADGSVHIFSIAGTLEWTGCLPRLIESVSQLQLPPNSFLDAELYIPNIETTESIQLVINSGSDTLGAANEAKLNPNCACFDVLVWNGQPVYKLPYRERLKFIPVISGSRLHPAKTYTFTALSEGRKIIEEEGIEGLVLADPKAAHNLNFNGNVKRGRSWKLKARYTEDFLATACTSASNPETGEFLGTGTLDISRRDETNNTFTPNGKIGSFEVTFDRVAAYNTEFPIVVEVMHFGRDTRGNLLFPKVIRRRPDLEHEWKIR
jgi:ATP-dependent DNA ligase